MTVPTVRSTPAVLEAGLPRVAFALDGTVLLVDEALSRLLGRPVEVLVGRPVSELLGDGSASRSLEEVCARGGAGIEGGDVTVEVTDATGSSRHLRVQWTLARRDDGTPSHVTAVCVDETERLEVERALASRDAHWQALLRNSSDLTWTADDAATILSVTAAAQGRLGRDAEEFVGTCAVDFVHEADRPAFVQAWEELVSGRARQQVLEYRLVDAAGPVGWFRATLTDMRAEPSVGALVGNVVDITDARALAQEHARFRLRFEQSSIPQSQVDDEGRLVLVNDALCTLLDRSAQELLGSPLSVLRHPEDDGAADRLLRRLLSGEVASGEAEQLLLRRDGTPVPVAVNATALRTADGASFGAAAHLLDLTALRESERKRVRQEELHAAFARLASDLALVADARGTILYASPAVTNLFGYAVEQVLASTGCEFVHPDDVGLAMAEFSAVLTETAVRTLQVRVRAADGTWRWVEKTLTNMLDSTVGGVLCNLRDVTQRVEAEQALRLSEETYRAIADTAEEGIWAVDPSGRTLYANARMAEILGLPLEEVHTRSVLSLFPPTDREVMAQRLATRAQRGSERYEIGYGHPDGTERRLQVSACPLSAADGSVSGSLGMVSDVTGARRVERELAAAALNDSLTSLPNRALLFDRLEQALARGSSVGALFVDLDQFKLVNDSRGHAAGDELLVEVAERLREVVRPSDTVARLAGDEFVVVCEGVDERQALDLADEVLDALGSPYVLSSGRVDLSASVGVVVTSGGTANDMVRQADAALFAAKAAGRGRVRLCDPTLAEEVEQRHALARDLREALVQDQLALHYQPLIDLTTGQVLGMEALARWKHPARGSVAPDLFVDVADASGLAPALDRWVLRRALEEAGRLHATGAIPPGAFISVNISARNVVDASLDEIESLTLAAGLTPDRVVLEITEKALMQDTLASVGVLRRLRGQGFGVAIDDFGTGYSSLAYLRDLPITCLKVDRSFIAHITTERDALAIVASIVDLGRAVGVTVVAEGVDTAEQAALLQRLGCTAAQGWLWSPALPPDEVALSGTWNRHFEVPAAGRSRTVSPRAAVEASTEVREAHGLSRLLELHEQGASLSTIASALNAEGFRTPAGLRWHRTSVARTVAHLVYPVLTSGPS